MTITVELIRSAPADAVATAIGVVSGQVEGPGVDGAFLAAQGFEATAGEIRTLPAAGGGSTFVVGLGPATDLTPDVLRKAAGNLARAAKKQPTLVVDLVGSLPPTADVAAGAASVVEGLVLGGYQYTAFKSKPKAAELAAVRLVAPAGKRVQTAVARALVVTEAVVWARDFVNEPGGSLTPTQFAKRVGADLAGTGLAITVWDEKEIKKERLGGVLGVSRGSSQPPRFIQLAYEPEKPRGTVALVGKGITFDSGGLSLKTAEGMVGMKGDMGGGAAVIGAMKAIAALGVKVRVIAFVPLTDNMTGPDATRPGDVLTIRNGTTVEVLNTDAEGRLILADGLSLASEADPDAIVDVATLTGACMVALGDRTAGLMAGHRGWGDQVRAAADAVGESVWPLPLPGYFRSKLDSDIADLKNITNGRYGGALSAGVFLQQFVGEGIPWVHLDIAGPADASETDGEIVKGGTGFGIRTLVELLSSWTKPKRTDA